MPNERAAELLTFMRKARLIVLGYKFADQTLTYLFWTLST